MRPSGVLFCGTTERDEERDGGYGDGREEAEVRAGWCRRPNGSFRFDANNKTVPAGTRSMNCRNRS